jgi:hypothetical protein
MQPENGRRGHPVMAEPMHGVNGDEITPDQDPWKPPSDPARHPESTRFEDAVLLGFGLAVLAIPLVICIIGIIKTWHGGTWTP